MTTPLPALERAAQVGLGRDAGILATAWASFQARPETNLGELADHLEATIDPVATAADALRDAARVELERREGLWRPVALELVRWLAEARVAYAGAAESERLKAEEKRLKDEQARLSRSASRRSPTGRSRPGTCCASSRTSTSSGSCSRARGRVGGST